MHSYPIAFYINGTYKEVNVEQGLNAVSLIKRLGFKGTKIGCNEGDCGACTIALAPIGESQFNAVASCILDATKLDGMQVITIEGLGNTKKLHLIQKAVRDCYGVQCGFCTPGIIMSLFCLFSNNSRPTMREVEIALQGNICRCTGYEGIRNATIRIIEDIDKSKNVYNLIIPKFVKKAKKIESKILNDNYFLPSNFDELKLSLEKNFKWQIINGGTDVFIEKNIGRKSYNHVLDLSRVKELKEITIRDKYLEIGGSVTIKEARDNSLVKKIIPKFESYSNRIASEQIRNVGTLSGNILTASPIADILVFLMALDSEVEIISKNKIINYKLKDFVVGYRKTLIKDNEILCKILIPLEVKDSIIYTNKTSKRKSDDIATVTSISCITKDIWRVAINGISSKVELIDNIYNIADTSSIENFTKDALDIANSYNTITDIRGDKEYRKLLIKNHLIKDYLKFKGVYDE